jgi:hypothetical protein
MTPIHRAAGMACALALMVSGCASESGSAAPTGGPSTQTTATSPSQASLENGQSVSGAAMAGHIHNLAYDGEDLLIGTHEGLWSQQPGSLPEQRSQDPFDVMGLTLAEDQWFASGHPGEGMDAPADLGLMASSDRGKTWKAASLSGEVDFHRLSASGKAIVGMSAHDGRLLRSDDAGLRWSDLGTPGLFDLAISPLDTAVIVGTTEDGPVRSSDSGVSFQPLAGAPLLALIAWSGSALYGVDVDGGIHQSTDSGTSWSAGGSLTGQATAIAASGGKIAALVGDSIVESVDGGATFSARIDDIQPH